VPEFPKRIRCERKSARNMIEIFELLFVKAEKSSLVKENTVGM
jgi:hypothetical protein